MKALSASELKSTITAMMLGDAYVDVNTMSGKARLDIYHKQANEDYIRWKMQVLESIPGIQCSFGVKTDLRLLSNGSTRKGFRLQTNFSYYLYKLSTESFKVKARRAMTPAGLAVLWQDNGTTVIASDRFNFANLCTERLSEEENRKIIQEWNNALGWAPRFAEYRRNTGGKTYHRLALRKEQIIALSDVIRDRVVDSMRYKLLTRQGLRESPKI